MPVGVKLETLAPALFVLIWSTGWIVAKAITPYADPLTFLALRFVLAAAVLGVIAFVLKSKWPSSRAGWGHALFSGLLLHTIYLGGVWWAIQQGVPSSVSGLLAALQPLMTAMIAYWLVAERLTPSQRIGILLGFAGLVIAIAPGFLALDVTELRAAAIPLVVNVISMASVTAGTVYQKRFLQEGDLLPVVTLQYIGAFIFIMPAVMLFEPAMRIEWTLSSIVTMAWSVLGLSLGAVMLLLYLIRRGQVSRAASLIYLVPPAVAIQAWLLFGEQLTIPLIIGTLVVVVGVWLVNRKPARENKA